MQTCLSLHLMLSQLAFSILLAFACICTEIRKRNRNSFYYNYYLRNDCINIINTNMHLRRNDINVKLRGKIWEGCFHLIYSNAQVCFISNGNGWIGTFRRTGQIIEESTKYNGENRSIILFSFRHLIFLLKILSIPKQSEWELGGILPNDRPMLNAKLQIEMNWNNSPWEWMIWPHSFVHSKSNERNPKPIMNIIIQNGISRTKTFNEMFNLWYSRNTSAHTQKEKKIKLKNQKKKIFLESMTDRRISI